MEDQHFGKNETEKKRITKTQSKRIQSNTDHELNVGIGSGQKRQKKMQENDQNDKKVNGIKCSTLYAVYVIQYSQYKVEDRRFSNWVSVIVYRDNNCIIIGHTE